MINCHFCTDLAPSSRCPRSRKRRGGESVGFKPMRVSMEKPACVRARDPLASMRRCRSADDTKPFHSSPLRQVVPRHQVGLPSMTIRHGLRPGRLPIPGRGSRAPPRPGGPSFPRIAITPFVHARRSRTTGRRCRKMFPPFRSTPWTLNLQINRFFSQAGILPVPRPFASDRSVSPRASPRFPRGCSGTTS